MELTSFPSTIGTCLTVSSGGKESYYHLCSEKPDFCILNNLMLQEQIVKLVPTLAGKSSVVCRNRALAISEFLKVKHFYVVLFLFHDIRLSTHKHILEFSVVSSQMDISLASHCST